MAKDILVFEKTCFIIGFLKKQAKLLHFSDIKELCDRRTHVLGEKCVFKETDHICRLTLCYLGNLLMYAIERHVVNECQSARGESLVTNF